MNYGIGNAVRSLLCGSRVYPFMSGDIGLETLLDWFERERITNFGPPVSLFRKIVPLMSGGKYFSNLRVLALTGQSVSPRDVKNFQTYFPATCILNHIFSSIEAYVITVLGINRETKIEGDSVSVGHSAEDKEVFILDDSGRRVPPGTTGEIAVRSKFLALGYWNDPELSRKKFLPDPDGGDKRIFLTGDLGVMDSDGCLTYVGRKDFQVKIRGFRVEMEAVELALLDLNGVNEAAVTAKEYPSGEKRLIAYIVPDKQSSPTVNDLRTGLLNTLPEYMVPSAFVFLESLPKLPNLKVNRKALPEPDAVRPEFDHEFIAPGTPLEKRLADILLNILRIDRIGIHDDFFYLGGDSLQLQEVYIEIRKAFEIDIPLTALLEFRTVSKIANYINSILSDEKAVPYPSMEAREASTGKRSFPLSSGQKRLLFLSRLEHGNPFYNITAKYGIRGSSRC